MYSYPPDEQSKRIKSMDTSSKGAVLVILCIGALVLLLGCLNICRLWSHSTQDQLSCVASKIVPLPKIKHYQCLNGPSHHAIVCTLVSADHSVQQAAYIPHFSCKEFHQLRTADSIHSADNVKQLRKFSFHLQKSSGLLFFSNITEVILEKKRACLQRACFISSGVKGLWTDFIGNQQVLNKYLRPISTFHLL